MSQSYCHKTDSLLGKPMSLQPVAPLSVAPPGMVGSILPGTLQVQDMKLCMVSESRSYSLDVFQPPLLPDIFIEEPESTDGARNPRYKTEICRNFKERSKCIFGDQVRRCLTRVQGGYSSTERFFDLFSANLPTADASCATSSVIPSTKPSCVRNIGCLATAPTDPGATFCTTRTWR